MPANTDKTLVRSGQGRKREVRLVFLAMAVQLLASSSVSNPFLCLLYRHAAYAVLFDPSIRVPFWRSIALAVPDRFRVRSSSVPQ